MMTQGQKITLFCLFLAGLTIQQHYQLWFASKGFHYMRLMEAKNQQAEQINQQLAKENADLLRKVQVIKHNPQVIEGILRSQYDLKKKGEIFIEYPHRIGE